MQRSKTVVQGPSASLGQALAAISILVALAVLVPLAGILMLPGVALATVSRLVTDGATELARGPARRVAARSGAPVAHAREPLAAA